MAPWGDPMMYENPGDELFFGQVYRQILSEGWYPSGSGDWAVVGKSRGGRRPTKRGITSPNLSQKESEVRSWFSLCASAFNDIPWEIPAGSFCDGRYDRKFYYDLKISKGYMCSYYDLYQRMCLEHCFSYGSLPPFDYRLLSIGDLSAVICNHYYPLTFPNRVGPVTLVSGPGTLHPLGFWIAPSCGDEGFLCFQDQNGALGPIYYTFHPDYRCEPFIWSSSNPSSIDAGQSVYFSVEGGVPPFSWNITGSGFSLSDFSSDGRTALLTASVGACGTCFFDITDRCGNVVDSDVLCSTGRWDLISHDPVLYGDGTMVYLGGGMFRSTFTLGGEKQEEISSGGGGCEAPCPDPPSQDCITGGGDPDVHCRSCVNPWPVCECIEHFPCYLYGNIQGCTTWAYYCFKTEDFLYYRWVC